jgi:hypothetical protein
VIDNRRMPRASGGHFGPLEQKAFLVALVDVFAPKPRKSRQSSNSLKQPFFLLVSTIRSEDV